MESLGPQHPAERERTLLRHPHTDRVALLLQIPNPFSQELLHRREPRDTARYAKLSADSLLPLSSLRSFACLPSPGAEPVGDGEYLQGQGEILGRFGPMVCRLGDIVCLLGQGVIMGFDGFEPWTRGLKEQRRRIMQVVKSQSG